MIKSEWDLSLFFVRPISAILGGMTIIVWFFPVLAAFLERRRRRNNGQVSKNTEIFLTSEGHLIEIIEGKLYPVKEGDVSILPSNIGHSALIREVDFKAIDIFVPPREDYLEKRCKTLKSTPDGVRFFWS